MRSAVFGVPFGTGFGAFFALCSIAAAQMPPPLAPEAAEIAACLCLKQAVDALDIDMRARQREYDRVHGELSGLDMQLERERAGMNVDNPDAVGRFRQLLQRRDALFQRTTGPLAADLSAAVARYNARIGEYNARCANRPRNPDLLAGVQATLACPPP